MIVNPQIKENDLYSSIYKFYDFIVFIFNFRMEGGLLNSLLVILVKSDTRLEEGTYVLCVSMK